ncbi:MAG TPA: hypothetical protein VHQ03_10435 [Candidatus Dormibacteraeota bacterium]|nr:hypothetical protein [Candidatus Dormibacteraeota bacterium]
MDLTKRIALIDLDTLNNEIVKAIIETQPELTLVYERPGAADLVRVAQDTHADVLIVGSRSVDANVVCALLERWPRLKTLAVNNDGQGGDLYEWRPRRTHLGELSPPTLLGAILGDAQGDCRELVS